MNRTSFASDLSTIQSLNRNLMNNSVTHLDRSRVNEASKLENLILQTLQEDVGIEKDLNNLSKMGISFDPASDIDDSLSTFSANPSVLTLRNKIYEQEKRKKYIKKKMATLTGINPIYN